MKRELDLLRTIVVSIEFLILLAWVIAFVINAEIPDWIKANTLLTDDKIKWLSLVPVGIMVLIFKDSSSFLFPSKDKQDIITDFPDYWIIRNMLSATIFYAVVFSVLGLLAWMLNTSKDSSRLVITLLAAVMGSGVVYLTFHDAISTINVIFASKGKKS